MERFRLNVQYPPSARGGEATGLLDDEGDGVALVKQPQLQGEEGKKDTLALILKRSAEQLFTAKGHTVTAGI